MDVYLSEEEQIQKIKDWWKNYGTSIIIGIIVFFAISFGLKYWRGYKLKTANQASIIYEQMLSADMQKKADDFKLFANNLTTNYAHTPYASLASLLLARANIANKDYKTARQNLTWVIQNANTASFKQIATIRLARILLATQQPDKALEALQKNYDPAFDALTYQIKGDIYLAQKDQPKALEAYQYALAKIKDPNNENGPILAMKINQLK